MVIVRFDQATGVVVDLCRTMFRIVVIHPIPDENALIVVFLVMAMQIVMQIGTAYLDLPVGEPTGELSLEIAIFAMDEASELSAGVIEMLFARVEPVFVFEFG